MLLRGILFDSSLFVAGVVAGMHGGPVKWRWMQRGWVRGCGLRRCRRGHDEMMMMMMMMMMMLMLVVAVAAAAAVVVGVVPQVRCLDRFSCCTGCLGLGRFFLNVWKLLASELHSF